MIVGTVIKSSIIIYVDSFISIEEVMYGVYKDGIRSPHGSR